MQADAPARMQIDDVLRLNVRNAAGGMVPLAEFATPVWSETPLQLVRYQGFLASRISGTPAPGASSGAAMAEMERLVAQLPPGFAVAWTGQSLQERQSAAQAPLLMALSMLVVFLVLAALYESWSIPLSVMLVVPLGLLGAVAAVLLRGMPNDVFFKVGLITIIGLSAKNAILIVEFAKQLREEGQDLREAAIKAARLRLRPILMTSLAFALGVVPLMLASGASAETQHAIGTGVFGGMVSGTVLAVFFVPVFFVFVLEWQRRIAGPRGSAPAAARCGPRNINTCPSESRSTPCAFRAARRHSLRTLARHRRLQPRAAGRAHRTRAAACKRRCACRPLGADGADGALRHGQHVRPMISIMAASFTIAGGIRPMRH